jgi:hypothetical protein
MVLSLRFYSCRFSLLFVCEGCNEDTSLQFVKAFYSSLATGAEKSSHDLLSKFLLFSFYFILSDILISSDVV